MSIDVSKIQKCFYVPNKPGVIDVINPDTGKGLYSKQTLEEAQAENAAIEVGDFDTVVEQQASYYIKPPQKISEEAWMEALEVLPPECWKHGADWERFNMCEYTSGTVTAIYCRIGEHYFVMSDEFTTKSSVVVAKCRALLS